VVDTRNLNDDPGANALQVIDRSHLVSKSQTIANERHHERKQDSNGENNDRARL
jgi:hypothetical protein